MFTHHELTQLGLHHYIHKDDLGGLVCMTLASLLRYKTLIEMNAPKVIIKNEKKLLERKWLQCFKKGIYEYELENYIEWLEFKEYQWN